MSIKINDLTASSLVYTDANKKLVSGSSLAVRQLKFISEYADLSTAISNIGSTKTTLWIDQDTAVVGTQTIPSTLEIGGLLNGAMFTGTGTLVINGPLVAPDRQIFASGLTVTLPKGFVPTPKMFGAVVNGVADDSAAIQRALNAIPADGGTLRFPPGMYYITQSLTPKSNTTIEGMQPADFGTSAQYYHADKGAVLVTAPGQLDNLPMIDVSNTLRVTIRNMAFLVSGDNSWAPTNLVRGIADLTGMGGLLLIEHNNFTGFGGTPLLLSGNVSKIIYNSMRNCYQHCIVIKNYNGAGGHTGVGSDSLIAFNDFGSTDPDLYDGIVLDGGGHNHVEGNQIFNCRNGIAVTNASQCHRIIGNRCEKHKTAAINLGSGANACLVEANVLWDEAAVAGSPGYGGYGIICDGQRNHLVGNHILSYESNSVSTPGFTGLGTGILIRGDYNSATGNHLFRLLGSGILIDDASYCKVSENFIHEIGLHGIHIRTASAGATAVGNDISGNTIRLVSQLTDNTYNGIFVAGYDASVGPVGTNVSRNQIRHTGAANRSQYGIRVYLAGCSFTEVTGNNLKDSGRAAAFTDSGTSTWIRGNQEIVDDAITCMESAIVKRYSTDAVPANLVTDKYRGTEAAPTAIQAYDVMGQWLSRGYDGASLDNGAKIIAFATQIWSAGNHGSALSLYVTPNNSDVVTEAWYIDQDGTLYPATDSAKDIGSSAIRVKAAYFDEILTGIAKLDSIKSGATQAAATAAAGELWKTASHATLPDNVVMIGV